jgi:hypothetical protein
MEGRRNDSAVTLQVWGGGGVGEGRRGEAAVSTRLICLGRVEAARFCYQAAIATQFGTPRQDSRRVWFLPGVTFGYL